MLAKLRTTFEQRLARVRRRVLRVRERLFVPFTRRIQRVGDRVSARPLDVAQDPPRSLGRAALRAQRPDQSPSAELERSSVRILARAASRATSPADRATFAEFEDLAMHAPGIARLVAHVAWRRLGERQRALAAVNTAIAARRLPPALREWAEGYATIDFEGFLRFLETAPDRERTAWNAARASIPPASTPRLN